MLILVVVVMVCVCEGGGRAGLRAVTCSVVTPSSSSHAWGAHPLCWCQEEVDRVSADVDKVVGMLQEERRAFEAQMRSVQEDCVKEMAALQTACAASVQRADQAAAAAMEGRASDRAIAEEQVRK